MVGMVCIVGPQKKRLVSLRLYEASNGFLVVSFLFVPEMRVELMIFSRYCRIVSGNHKMTPLMWYNSYPVFTNSEFLVKVCLLYSSYFLFLFITSPKRTLVFHLVCCYFAQLLQGQHHYIHSISPSLCYLRVLLADQQNNTFS